jgi:hypothetical protein
MRRALLAQGIPAEDVFTDHAGFDTWDGAQRARQVGLRSVVVVTQRFHMARALFAAHRAGLQARRFPADRRGYGRVMTRPRVREALARVKVVADAGRGRRTPTSVVRRCRPTATNGIPAALTAQPRPPDRTPARGWLPWSSNFSALSGFSRAESQLPPLWKFRHSPTPASPAHTRGRPCCDCSPTSG